MKKTLSIILCITMLLSVFPISVFADAVNQGIALLAADDNSVYIDGEELMPSVNIIGDSVFMDGEELFIERKAEVQVAITSANVIDQPGASLTLTASVSAVNPDEAGAVTTTDVTWTVDDDFICKLEGNVLTAIANGTVNVTATSVYDKEKTATYAVTITGQPEQFVVTFDKGTGADVANMPSKMLANGKLEFPSQIPARTGGFKFLGWKTSLDSETVLTSFNVTENTTLYAAWAKGTVIEFNEESDKNLFTYNSYITDVKVEDGFFKFKTKPHATAGKLPDPQILLTNVDGYKYRYMEFRVGMDSAGQKMKVYYSIPTETAYSEAKTIELPITGTLENPEIVKFDFWTKDNTKVVMPNLRIDVGEKTNAITYIDYIRVKNDSVETIAIKDVVEPVAGFIPETTATSEVPAKYTVKSVTWTPELLYDYYFDGLKAYTVNVTISPENGYVLTDKPVKATVNNQDAVGYVLNSDGTATVSYTFPKTGDLASSASAMLTFNMGNGETKTKQIFVGESFDLSKYIPTYIPEGYRFAGWSTQEGNASKVENSVVASDDTEYFAIYDSYSKFDFNNLYHSYGVTSNAELLFNNGYAFVTASGETQDAYLTTPVLSLPANTYGIAKITVDANLIGEHNGKVYANQFKTNSKPNLLFSLAETPDTFDATNVGQVIEVIENREKGTITYVYDLASNETWAGKLGKLKFDPYNGYPVWAIKSIELVENTFIEGSVTIKDLESPKTWFLPDEYATGDNIVVTNVEWDGEFYEGGQFKAQELYTVTVTAKTKPGYAFDENCVVYIGDEQAAFSEVDTDTNTITASYVFDFTEALSDIEVVVTGPDIISRNGRYMDYSAKVIVLDGTIIPIKDVVWSVRNNRANNDGKVRATITENGRLTPVINGKVDVIATSVYDPTVRGIFTVTLENQSATCTVHFDKNTQATVTGMPADVTDVKGTVTLEIPTVGGPKRTDGYYFAGWATSPDTTQTVTSVTVNKDTTLYAAWEKVSWGLEFDTDVSAKFKPTNSENISYDTANGIVSFTTTKSDANVTYTIPAASVGVGANNATLKVRVATNATETQKFTSYFTTKYANGDYLSGTWAAAPSQYLASMITVNHTPSGLDTFDIIVGDFSSKSGWGQYLDTIRLDIFEGNIGSKVVYDYVRLVDASRTITLNANGGQFETGTTKSVNGVVGNIAITDVPTREGCQFMGWSKDPSSMDVLYSTSVFAMDDLTLYAMWSPAPDLSDIDQGTISDTVVTEDESQAENMDVTSNADGLNITSTDVVRPVIKIVDSIVANQTNNTLLIKLKYSYSNMTDGAMAVRFKQEGASDYTYITVESSMPRNVSSAKYYTGVLSESDGYTGAVTDVALVLPEGQIKNLTIYELSLTGEAAAQSIVEDSKQKPLPAGPGVSNYNPSTDGDRGYEKDDWDSAELEFGKTSEGTTAIGSTSESPVIEKFEYVNSYVFDQFKDVPIGTWFYGDVEKTYKLGFMEGVSADEFDPDGNVTIAQAITIAARINATYNKTTINESSYTEWYMPYVNYATEKGIIKAGQYDDYTKVATRRQVVYILYSSMKPEWFTKINDFDSVPDVYHNAHDYNAILAFYNAGILQGVDGYYNFAPEANIRRCELSAIINRIATPESRIKH